MSDYEVIHKPMQETSTRVPFNSTNQLVSRVNKFDILFQIYYIFDGWVDFDIFLTTGLAQRVRVLAPYSWGRIENPLLVIYILM